MIDIDFDSMFTLCANDNAPNDPLDYDDLNPADCLTPYPDDMTMDVATFMSLIA